MPTPEKANSVMLVLPRMAAPASRSRATAVASCVAGGAPPIVFVAAFCFVAWILTELLSNNAVAVLLTPIALSLARTTGINPMALVMVVVFGASAGFILPQGYQTYAMVMGPGGYRFIDFLKFGLPLSLLCWLTASLLIPVFWPLLP